VLEIYINNKKDFFTMALVIERVLKIFFNSKEDFSNLALVEVVLAEVDLVVAVLVVVALVVVVLIGILQILQTPEIQAQGRIATLNVNIIV
jgi:hypothetical protein